MGLRFLFLCVVALCSISYDGYGQNNCSLIDSDLCYVLDEIADIDFQVEKKWESEEQTAEYTSPLVIDVDGDCISEIIAISSSLGQIIVNDSKDGSTKYIIEAPGILEMTVVDANRNGEIEFIVRFFGLPQVDPIFRGRLVSYNLDGSINWISNVEYDSDFQTSVSESLGVTDFNKDGIPEVYILNEIYNALTGVKISDGGDNGKGYNSSRGVSVAGELDGDDSSLELAAGYTIYHVEITNTNGETGNVMTPYNIEIDGSFQDGLTIIADVNSDNKLDVIVSSKIGGNTSGIYVYEYNNGVLQLLDKIDKPELNSTYSTGLPVVYNSGNLDSFFLVYAVIDSIECHVYVNGLFKRIWTLPFSDIEATNGIVAFDLDSDGIKEIVCRDEENLQIIRNGNTNAPSVINFICRSGTDTEKPIIAGIDSTRQARICVNCRNELGESRLTVFGPPEGSHWAPARGIWNQYNYNVLNINDDGTVPQFQENNATYQDGRYNNFMVQASTLDEDGNMLNPAANLVGEMQCVDYDIETDTYTVTFDIHNLEDASLDAASGMYVSFYDGDPTTTGTLVGVYLTTLPIDKNTSLLSLQYSFAATDLTQFFMVVNTDGVTPGSIDEEDYDILECDYTDNMSQYVSFPSIAEIIGSICNGSTYDFYGLSLSIPGDYLQIVEDQNGCDSIIAKLMLEVRDTIFVDLDITVCDTFFIAQDTLLESGDYEYEDISINGCDSITQLTLTVLTSSMSTTTLMSCDSLEWNGIIYDNSDTYFYLTSNVAGCDSIAVLDLTINISDSIIINIQSCESYDWNGNNYTESGTYFNQETNALGCDSLTVLDLEIMDVLNETEIISTCDSLIWNGVLYTESGLYSHDTISVNDCDSTAMLELVVNNSMQQDTIAISCDSFYWRGEIYFSSGTYTTMEQSINGCDSMTVLLLEILPSTIDTLAITQCESYEWNGQLYTESGEYLLESTSVNGCDSVSSLQLIILDVGSQVLDLQACDSLVWHDGLYTESGTYTFDTINVSGCDSTVTINLEITKSEEVMLEMKTCDTLFYQGDTLIADGEYFYDLTNVEGCDSSIVLDLSLASDYMQESLADCDSLVWEVNGETYLESGMYYQSYTNISGCDSIYELDLTIHSSYESFEMVDVCGEYLWTITGELLFSSGTYTEENVTAEGCDSISVLDLMIHPTYEIHDTVYAVNEYYWEVDNTNYSQSGIYEYDLSTDQDCDSIQVLHLFLDYNSGILTPNIISTNDANGNFTIYGDQKTALIKKLFIFDRWGSLIAERINIAPSQPALGWDGKFEGQRVVPGVYIWMAELELDDGSISTKYGDVTVIW